MRLIIVDTGVLSRRLSNKEEYIKAFDYIGNERIVITSITKIELFNWVRAYRSHLGEKKYKIIFASIDKFPTIHIDRKTSTLAVELSQRYFTKIGNLLIASVAIQYEIEIFTNNTKDFKNIKGVKLYTPPNYEEIAKTL